MNKLPEHIADETELEELLSRPDKAVVDLMNSLEGDIIFLGIAGKIGPSIARMAKRACELAGVKKRIIGVSRFSNTGDMQKLASYGIDTLKGDLLDRQFLEDLPEVKNVFFSLE